MHSITFLCYVDYAFNWSSMQGLGNSINLQHGHNYRTDASTAPCGSCDHHITSHDTALLHLPIFWLFFHHNSDMLQMWADIQRERVGKDNGVCMWVNYQREGGVGRNNGVTHSDVGRHQLRGREEILE